MNTIRFYILSFFLFFSLFTFSFADEVVIHESEIFINPSTINVTETEGRQTVNVTISLDHCPTFADIQLKYYTNNNSGAGNAGGGDYVSTSGNITFPVGGGTCSQTIPVQIKGDTLAEVTEKFYLNFARRPFNTLQKIKWPDGGTSARTRINIIDNDTYHESKLTISADVSVNEGNTGTTLVPITFSLDHCPTFADIKLKYYTGNGSAKYWNGDYTRITTKYITFPMGGPCTKTVNVEVKGDTTRENNENFYFYVKNHGTNRNQHIDFQGRTRAKITILNDDQQADLRMRKSVSGGSTRYHAIGDIVTFTLKAKNHGPNPSTMHITDALPAGLVYVPNSISDNKSNFSCSVTANVITCDGTRVFNKNQEVKIEFKAKTTAAGFITNSASVYSANGVFDNRLSNNVASIGVAVGTPGGGQNTVDIAKTVNDATPDVGDTVSFTVTVTNKGFDKRIAMRDKFAVNGDDWGTTGGAFEFLSVSGVPAGVTCENLTHNSSPYLFCYSDGNYTHNESFSVTIDARIKKAGHLCNRAYAYEYYWTNRRTSTVCVDANSVNPPTLDPLDPQDAYVGSSFSYNIHNKAHDLDGDPITFSATGLPPGLSISSNGHISGTPTDDGPATYTATVTVTDQPFGGAAPQSASRTIEIEVHYPDVIAGDDTYNIEHNQTLIKNVSHGLLENDNGYFITIISHTPVNATDGNLTLNPDGSFTFQPTLSFLGSITFEYTIQDTQGTEDTGTVTINVSTDYEDGFQPFELINPEETRNVLGDFVIAGNTIECISDSTTGFDGVCTDNQTYISNDYVTKYIDMDEDNSTWNSSSSYFTLPTRFDHADKGILWAGLFWQGRFTQDAVSLSGEETDRITRYGKSSGGGYVLESEVNTNNIGSFNANKIKLKINSGNSYNPVTSYENVVAETLYSNRNDGGVSYAAFANVTGILKDNVTHDGSFTATVANLPTAEGWENNPGLYGGWSLVVIYAEDFRGKVRNVSVYSGYDQILGDEENAVPDSSEITISGFRLPAQNAINASLAMFSGEGEHSLGAANDRFDRVLLSKDGSTYTYTDGTLVSGAPYDKVLDNSFDAKLTGIDRASIAGHANDLSSNNTGLDIDFFNISDVMTIYRNDDANISSVNIKWETNLDTVNPSMMVFAAELYVPKLCYDYSYKQNGITFSEDNNGTEKPYIRGEWLSVGDPITVELYLRNEEESDATLQNVKFDIYDINTTQATYISGSTYVTYADKYVKTHIDDSDMNTSHSFIKDIPLGNIGSKDALYIDYDIDPKNSDIDIPLDGRVNFTLDLLGGISYDLSIYLESMPVCGNDRYSYFPQYDIFNVEDKALSSNTPRYYDLPTQIVERVGDYSITAYNNDFETPKDVTTMVAVELIDVGKYHDVNASCYEPDNTLSPRVWMAFDNNQSQIDFTDSTIQAAIDAGRTSSSILTGQPAFATSSDFYNKARKNVAFRVSYLRTGEKGDVLQLVDGGPQCTNKQQPCYDITNYTDLPHVNLSGIPGEDGNCIQDMQNGQDKIVQHCGSGGFIDGATLPGCLECIYGHNIRYVCSRDNFAMRPKSFRIALSDQNQTDLTSQRSLITNNDNTSTWNIVAGYTYHMDINATSFASDAAVPGYFGYFDASGEDGNRSIGYKWDSSNPSNCLDTSDENSTTHFFNGAAGLDAAHNQIGIYKFSIIDKMYTQVDWYPKYMTHQLRNHFLSGIDCTTNSSVSLPEGTATSISSPDLSNVNGCEIASDLTSDGSYTDLTAQLYPYTFNLEGLTVTVGPSNKAFVYIDSPSIVQTDNTNMSYNVIGTYFAADYTGGQLSNFTEGCWADNTVMGLSFTYNHTQPASTPYLSYSLQDVNTSNSATIYKPSSGIGLETGTHNSITSPFSIAQQKPFYKTEMAGAITMDLGFNFMRQNNLPLEPRYITFKDFNLTYNTNPSTLHAEGVSNYTIRGTLPLNQNVTFLYGRAKPSQTLYDNVTASSVQTPVSVVGYCSLGRTNCQNRGFPLLNAQTNEADWWLVTDHVTADDDGNISIKISSGTATVSPTSVGITGNGTNNSVTVTNTGTVLPMTAVIDLDNGTNKWLIYNPLNALTAPSPFYRVRFIGASNWAGHGDTGHVVGGTVNKKKNQRLGW